MTEIETQFHELGYKIMDDDDKELVYERYEGGIDEYIRFDKQNHEVSKQWCMEMGDITMPELQVIIAQCKEFGWLKD